MKNKLNTDNREEYFYSSKPSQWLIFHHYLLLFFILIGALFIPPVILDFSYFKIDCDWLKYGITGFVLLKSLHSFLKIFCISYEISNERLIIYDGILTREREEVELYRVKDYKVISPVFLRPLNLGHIYMDTSDKTTPRVTLKGIKQPYSIVDQIRYAVEEQRKIKGVREFD